MAKRGRGARASASAGAGREADQWRYLSALSVAPLRPSSGTWLVTFTDLVALLLAFFVLMFSMTKIDEARWQGLIRSLASALDSIREETVSRPAVDYQIPAPAPDMGTNLAYLAPVVLEQLAAEPALSRALIRRLPDRIVVSLPAEALFASASARLNAQGKAVAFAIGGIVRNIRNVLTVEAVGGAAIAGGDHWSRTLARAATLADELRASGYGGGIAAVGRGPGGGDDLSGGLEPEGRASFETRIDLVIHERARDD
jgi:chemotaxis protein MotB